MTPEDEYDAAEDYVLTEVAVIALCEHMWGEAMLSPGLRRFLDSDMDLIEA